MVQNNNVLISSALLHETMAFHTEYRRFPEFFTTLQTAFVNDVMAIGLGHLYGPVFIEWYQHHCLPLQYPRSKVGKDADIFAALPQAWRLTQEGAERTGIMPFPDLRQILDPLAYTEITTHVDAKLIPYIIDLLFCFVRGSGLWEIITTTWSKGAFEKAFQFFKTYAKMESHDPVLEIRLCTPSSYLFDHRVFYGEFNTKPFSFELYHAQDLPSPAELQEDSTYTFYPPIKFRSKVSVGKKMRPWEEIAFKFPGQLILEEFAKNAADSLEHSTSHRDPLMFPNLSSPAIFLVTPAALLDMIHFYCIDSRRMSPVVKTLVRQGYLRFACFGEFIPFPKIDPLITNNIIANLNPIILPPIKQFNPLVPRFREKIILQSRQMLEDCEVRGKALKKLLKKMAKENPGQFYGIMGTPSEQQADGHLFTLQSLLLRVFMDFKLDLEVLKRDNTVLALSRPTWLVPQTYFAFPSARDKHPLTSRFDFPAWLSAYNHAAIAKSKKEYPVEDWEQMNKWENAHKTEEMYFEEEDVCKNLIGSEYNDTVFLKDSTRSVQEVPAHVWEELQKPFQIQLREVLQEILPTYFPELQEKIEPLLALITHEFTHRDLSIPYAYAAVLLSQLSSQYSPQKIRRYLKRRCGKDHGPGYEQMFDSAYAFCTKEVKVEKLLPEKNTPKDKENSNKN